MAARYPLKPFVVAALVAFGGGIVAGLVASCAQPVGSGADDDDDDVAEGEGEGEGEGEPTARDLAIAELDGLLVGALDTLPAPGISACVVKDGAVAWCGAAGMARIAESVP